MGIVVDGVTQQHYTAEKVWMWIGALVLIAVMVYLLRYNLARAVVRRFLPVGG